MIRIVKTPCLPLLRYLLLTGAIASALPACGQVQEKPRTNNFEKLFTNPTGQNGYEEFVQAGDILLNAPAWQDYDKAMSAEQSLTLAMKRRVASDPMVRSAMETLRAGLKKPVRSPRAKLDDETLWPELATFRTLGRLASVVMYVELADGRISQALDTFSDVLKFGYVSQTDSLISGLVAVAIDTTAA